MGAMYSDNAEISSDDDNSINANRSNSNQINHFGVDIYDHLIFCQIDHYQVNQV